MMASMAFISLLFHEDPWGQVDTWKARADHLEGADWDRSMAAVQSATEAILAALRDVYEHPWLAWPAELGERWEHQLLSGHPDPDEVVPLLTGIPEAVTLTHRFSTAVDAALADLRTQLTALLER
jgi:hypothetical protein